MPAHRQEDCSLYATQRQARELDCTNPRSTELLVAHDDVQHVLRLPLEDWPGPLTRSIKHPTLAIYVLMQGPGGLGASGRLLSWGCTADLGSIVVPRLVIGVTYDTLDPLHMAWVAQIMQQGRSLYCSNGSHLACYADQQRSSSGLIQFVHDVDAGRFSIRLWCLMRTYSPGLAQACQTIIAALERLKPGRQAPLLVALDGGSGAGKSTLALALAEQLHAALVPLDDFFAAHIPDAGWDARSVEERARDVFDWHRLRVAALEPLRSGRPATWHRFDFAAGQRADGSYGMCAEPVQCEPAPVIILEGAYSGHPELADLIDLAVLVDVPVGERHRRLARREEAGFLERWHARWDAVEAYYFSQLRPSSSYDLVVSLGSADDKGVASRGHS